MQLTGQAAIGEKMTMFNSRFLICGVSGLDARAVSPKSKLLLKRAARRLQCRAFEASQAGGADPSATREAAMALAVAVALMPTSNAPPSADGLIIAGVEQIFEVPEGVISVAPSADAEATAGVQAASDSSLTPVSGRETRPNEAVHMQGTR